MAQQTESLFNTDNGHRFIIPEILQEPVSITFYWNDNSVKVQLKNAEDVLKLADILSKMLTENGIENTIEKKS